ncbi:AI-2E family transporter [Litchfieldia salsa]|uniref:Predicted PurR-regulated permease PerM n=1 Tax=Litchfieldia salsa TaxID=930152 RepID=A0A1H0V731_9BACI|nr:AI-2E family transporter [Litchfieldia salsa]SDP74181.1 Predicted PurR-regulated permease PerM [Litchfieldia salsa]
MNNVQLRWIFRITLFLLVSLLVLILVKLSPIWVPILMLLKVIFVPFFISIFITYLLHPLIEKIHGRGLPRALAILFIYLLFFGGLSYGVYLVIPILLNQLRDLVESVPELMNSYRVWLQQIEYSTSRLPTGLHARIDEAFVSFENSMDQLITRVVTMAKGLLNSIVIIAIIPFIVFYMLKDYDQMKKALWYLTPRKWRQPIQFFLKDVDESLGNYIRGQLLVCLLMAVIASLALWLSGMKYPVLLGFIIGITDIIPYFGPVIGAIPAVIIAATISNQMIIIVIIIVFGLQFIEGNLLSPLIVGKSLHMHPIMIMVALLLGGEVGGVVGLLVAVPILAIVRVILLHVKSHLSVYRKNKNFEDKRSNA